MSLVKTVLKVVSLCFGGIILLNSCTIPVSKVSVIKTDDSLSLWYDKPAQKWDQALPVGNGRLGAMVFGGVETERIQLNEESIWAGPPVPQIKPGMLAVRECINDSF